MTQRSRLRNTKISSVHVVDKGDNPEAKFAMFKRVPEEEEISKEEIDELIQEEQNASPEDAEPKPGILANWLEQGRNLFGSTTASTNSISNLQSATAGANPQYTVKVDPAATLPALAQSESEEFEKAGRKMSAARLKALKEAHATLDTIIQQSDAQSTGQESTQKGEDMPIDPTKLEGLDEDVRKYIADLEEQNQKVEKKEEETPDENPLYKGLNQQQIEFFKAQAAAVDTMKREREERDYIEKSRKFGDLPANPGELGPVLRRVAKGSTTDKDEEYLLELLGSVNAVVKNSEMFRENGSIVRGFSGTAEQELSKKADELALAEKINKEVAFAKVARDPANAEIVKRYYEEVSN